MDANVSVLNATHTGAFTEALSRVLSTEVAEFTYAQIIDGLPTEKSFAEFDWHREGHPVFELEHTSLCPGVLERIREFRHVFDPLALTFPLAVKFLHFLFIDSCQRASELTRVVLQLLSEFQKTHPGTQRFELRLIELLAVACHQIAVFLYNLDDGVHKHCVYETWRNLPREPPRGEQPVEFIPPTVFYHGMYFASEQYPNGVADIVGYWAEAKIFGGVVLFDRGESGTEVSKAMAAAEAELAWRGEGGSALTGP